EAGTTCTSASRRGRAARTAAGPHGLREATQARKICVGSEGPAPARALMPCLYEHVDQVRHALARQPVLVLPPDHALAGGLEYPDPLRDEAPAVTRLRRLGCQRQHVTRSRDPLGHAARQRLALAHRALEDAVQHLEPGFRVAVLVVAEARVARERGLELAGGGAAVAVLGVAIVALLARFEVAVATDGRSARRHHEVALVVTLVARRAVGGSVVALLAGVDNAISTAADAA